MSQSASTVIPLPLPVVESNIWDVTVWPTFMADLDWVERTAHERYVCGVRQGRRIFEVPLAVRWHAREHRVVWREMTGPLWRGEIRLTAMNGRRTKVTMEVTVQPRTLLGRLSEVLGGRRRDLDLDLRKLSQRLSAIPQPVNPARLTPTGRLRHRPAVPSTAPEYSGQDVGQHAGEHSSDEAQNVIV